MEGGASAVSGIQTALTTAFTTMAGDATSAIAAILPIVLPVVGAIAVITLGVRLFKKYVK